MEDHPDHGGHRDSSHGAPRGYAPDGHAVPGGLAVAANGLRFEPSKTRFRPDVAGDWTFRVVGQEGSAVTEFEEAHGRRSHLIVVRRDMAHFQHLHPSLEPDGTWHVEGFALPEPGAYRAFVDVVVDGRPTTLGVDLFASGTWDVHARPGSTRRATADGYEFELLTDEIRVDEPTRLTFEVRRDAAPVSRLDEYLGALGHLVALREGDLGYLHVHPEVTKADSGRVEFGARFPTAGRYRLFLQTKPDGRLCTTTFDLTVE